MFNPMDQITFLLDQAKGHHSSNKGFPTRATARLLEKLKLEIENSEDLDWEAKRALKYILSRVAVPSIGRKIFDNKKRPDRLLAELVLKYHCWGYPNTIGNEKSSFNFAVTEYKTITEIERTAETAEKAWKRARNENRLIEALPEDFLGTPHDELIDSIRSIRDLGSFKELEHSHRSTVAAFVAHCAQIRQPEDDSVVLAAYFVHGDYGKTKTCLGAFRQACDENYSDREKYLSYKFPNNIPVNSGIPSYEVRFKSQL